MPKYRFGSYALFALLVLNSIQVFESYVLYIYFCHRLIICIYIFDFMLLHDNIYFQFYIFIRVLYYAIIVGKEEGMGMEA